MLLKHCYIETYYKLAVCTQVSRYILDNLLILCCRITASTLLDLDVRTSTMLQPQVREHFSFAGFFMIVFKSSLLFKDKQLSLYISRNISSPGSKKIVSNRRSSPRAQKGEALVMIYDTQYKNVEHLLFSYGINRLIYFILLNVKYGKSVCLARPR